MTRRALGVCGFVLAAIPAPAAGPDPKALAIPADQLGRAKELVTRLADPQFHVREDATQALYQMGRLALPAVRDGVVRNPDPEVRHRCTWLLPRAEAADLRAKLDTFLADKDGKFEHDLPGWAALRKVTGNTPAARALFAEILDGKGNVALLMQLGGTPEVVAKAVGDRRTQLHNQAFGRTVWGGRVSYRMTTPAVPDVAALLLAETEVPVIPHLNRFVATPIGQTQFLITRGLTPDTLAGGPYADPVRKLLVHWLESLDPAQGVYARLNLTSQLGLDELGLKYALAALDLPAATKFQKAQALGLVARFGRAKHLPTLTKFFGDDTMLTARFVGGAGGNRQYTVEMRDFALAMAAVATGQEPKDYGLEAINYGGAGDTIKYNYTNYWFSDDGTADPGQKREAAFKKWDEWKKKHDEAEKNGKK